MYNFKLEKDEEIILISDNTKVLNKDNYFSSIITNKRLLILDYPSSYHNSMEELRIMNKMNYIKMKEIIFSQDLNSIKDITNKNNYYEIIFNDNTKIVIDDESIINELKNIIIQNK